MEECDTYLTHVYRHHCSRENPLLSWVTVTWAHPDRLENNYNQALQASFLTEILGIYFTALQAYEYLEASFTIADSWKDKIYDRVFSQHCGFLRLSMLSFHWVLSATVMFTDVSQVGVTLFPSL